MREFKQVQDKVRFLVETWSEKLLSMEDKSLPGRTNSQNRTVKQIMGHMVDSASNNLHRIIHLQYQPSPNRFPDYANHGVNDIWITLQNYEQSEWSNSVLLWKHLNLHLVHVIGNVSQHSLENIWISALEEEVTLKEMVIDYPRHLHLHLEEIEELLDLHVEEKNRSNQQSGWLKNGKVAQLQHYADKLAFEIDSYDLNQLLRKKKEVVIIDVRSNEVYLEEHLPEAVSLPHRSINEAAVRDLDGGKLYVVYCDGIGCNGSTKGALKLTELGFRVKELQGGLDWWKRDGLPTVRGIEQGVEGRIACGCEG